MPRISVNVAVNSSYLVDIFAVQRRLENVGANGRSALTLVTFNTVAGVVVPDGDNRLKRESDNQTQKQTISVITKFMLQGASLDGVPQNYQPDIVIWHGNSYIVDNIEPYSAYGPGFVDAECCVIDMEVMPPVAGEAMLIVGKLQQYPLTQVSSTVFTAAVIPTQSLLFRNGLLQAVPGDYTIVSNLSGTTITLATPLTIGEGLAFYA